MGAKDLDGFTRETFDHDGISHPVYRAGSGPGVLLLHELPGMSPQCVDLGRRIAAAGFTVFMPLFFGRPNHSVGLGPRAMARAAFLHFCVRREWNLLATGASSPVTVWVRALARKVHRECGGPGVGAIGMCLTGNFALALLLEEEVLAPVASQPSLPLWTVPGLSRPGAKASLGLGPEELARSRERAAQGVEILGLRFSHDPYCHRQRFETLRQEYGDALEIHEIPSGPGNPHGLPKDAHSVLTGAYAEDGESLTPVQEEARERVIGFLRERLASPAGAPAP